MTAAGPAVGSQSNDAHLSLDDSRPQIALSIGLTKDNQFAWHAQGKVFAFGPYVHGGKEWQISKRHLEIDNREIAVP